MTLERIDDTAPQWRTAALYLYLPTLGTIDKRQAIEIGPGQSARALEQSIARDLSMEARHVFLTTT